jgi:cyclopropane fatty-acyl-phospholipid synthase-like methyltransferase
MIRTVTCRLAALALAILSVTASGQDRRTPDIHFVGTPPEVVNAMLELAGTSSSDVVYDLGSGDGRIVIAAAEKYGARGVGIEIDPALVAKARKNAEQAGVTDRVTFIEGNLFDADLSDATIVTLFLSFSTNRRLQSKLMTELKPGARVVSHRFEMADWPPDKEVRAHGTRLYLWRIG